MKLKLATLTIIGLFACSLAVAQPAPAGDATPADQPAPAAAEPAAETQPATAEDTVVEEPSTLVETNAVEPQEDVIPLIQFQDVQLTTAIENLARQAGINYILDPKVGFGQLDERGNARTQPNISIRWENVTASQALTAVLQNHGLQILSDPKTKIARITIKDPAAPEPLQTRILQLKYANPSNVVASVQATLTDKRAKVIADTRTSQLVVLATEREQDAVEKLIVKLDTQTKQVLIEAKILETNLNPKTAKGVDWSGTLAGQQIEFGNNALSGTPASSTPIYDPSGSGAVIGYDESPGTIGGILSNPKLLANTKDGFSPSTFFLNADGVSAVVSFLNSSSDTKVVSEPRMVTLDNQKATIDVGLMFPIVNTTAGTANTTGGSSISYSNLTINLEVTPRIAANNYIELKVGQGVMRLGPTFQSQVGGVNNAVNSFLTRRLDTSVLIPSGNTLVMGGLIADETRNESTKVPILGDIPFLGLLFRHEGKALDRNNLILFITPTVVGDGDFQPAQSTYLKSTGQDEVTEGWSAWDSGKAKDWSNPSSQKTAVYKE